MSEEILVSVCVITFNHEGYIAECLDSILNQETNFKFNIFVSDDCSQDHTLEVLREYEKNYSNVHVISRCGREKSYYINRPTGNMNFVENISNANGKYIAICDGDDVWASSDKLQTQVDILSRRDDIALVCSSKNILSEGKIYITQKYLPDIAFPSTFLCFYNPIPASSAMFRKSDFHTPPKWFFHDLDIGDWPLWYQTTRGKKIYRISRPLLNYRVHPEGAWGKKKKLEKAFSALNVVTILNNEYGDYWFRLSSLLHRLRLSFYAIFEK